MKKLHPAMLAVLMLCATVLSGHRAHPKPTDIYVVLDRSGSMESMAADAIGGFNRFLADQQGSKHSGRITMSLFQFDDEYECVFERTAVVKVEPLTDETFVPRGMTALLDAIGRTIEHARAERISGHKLIFVILTDGEENHSTEFDHQQINRMISDRQEAGVPFVFLAANQDAIQTASQLGISAATSLTFTGSTVGIAIDAASGLVDDAVSLTDITDGIVDHLSFTDEQREEAAGETDDGGEEDNEDN